MLTVGQVCVKTAGRDAAEFCVIVEELDGNYVLVDGNTRRKKVNRSHLQPVNKQLSIKKGASTEDVLSAFGKAGIETKKEAKEKPAKTSKKTKKED
jgi:large subunit ribosomal protein L14e